MESPSLNDELRTELLTLADLDQDVRARVGERWPTATPIDTEDPLYAEWIAVDEASTERLKAIVSEHGWPGYRLVGTDGAHAAWLLVQHTADRDFMRRCLGLLRTAVATGDASPVDGAYLEDRVLMYDGEAQIYGTQYQGREGKLTLWRVADPERLDERRAAVGLPPAPPTGVLPTEL